jgi:hypothetical protein
MSAVMNSKNSKIFAGLFMSLICCHSNLSNAGEIRLVRVFETWKRGIVRSTDPAGITYHPPSGRLFISDSEINEIFDIWNCENIFEISLSGDQVFKTHDAFAIKGLPCPPTSNYDHREPAGITYNRFDGSFYVTDDKEPALLRYDVNFGAPLASVSFPGLDLEGVTSDPSTGYLYVTLGEDKQVFAFDSNFPDTPYLVYKFSTSEMIMDSEGIAYSSASNHLFLVSSRDHKIYEYTLNGAFVDEYDLKNFVPAPRSPQGLTFAPSSDPTDDPNHLSLYIVDGQKDNGKDGAVIDGEPDGRVYEMEIPSQNVRLQVYLSFFVARPGDEQITLEWMTASESKIIGFIIERSLNVSGPYITIASHLTHPELRSKGGSDRSASYSFQDTEVQNNVSYFYRLIHEDTNGMLRDRGPIKATPPKNMITAFKLLHNYPNPFNLSTTILIEIPSSQNTAKFIELSVYNSMGRLVKKLLSTRLSTGVHKLNWDGRNDRGQLQASGAYFLRMRADDLIEVKKIILVR